jgi:flagellar hook-basal body complex protein FliE
MAIGGIKSLGSIDPRAIYGVESPQSPTKTSFADQLKSAINEVDQLQTNREQMVEGMVTGQATEVHDVMIAAKEAQLAFELLLEVRNKLLESYQEIMRLQV